LSEERNEEIRSGAKPMTASEDIAYRVWQKGCSDIRAYASKGRPKQRKPTGDDDSVTHAWNTEPVAVIVDVDQGIAPLIKAFNKIPGVRTFASCEGHPHSKEMTDAYVMLYMPPESIEPLATAIERALLSTLKALELHGEFARLNVAPHDCGQGYDANCPACQEIASQTVAPAQAPSAEGKEQG
jgi:hypothetical protein